MTVIAVFNQKGGVGKTTVTANLAAAMAQNGQTPFVIDLDPQAHLSHYWGFSQPQKPRYSVHEFFRGVLPLSDLAVSLENGIHFVPSHLELSKVDAQITRHRDHIWRLKLGLTAEMLADSTPVLIDCGPMLGVLSFAALLAADLILVPVAPEMLALNGAAMTERTLLGLEKLDSRKTRRYLLNRHTPGSVASETVLKQMQRHFYNEVLKTRIRCSESFEAAVIGQSNVFDIEPDGTAAQDFGFLLDELVESELVRLND
ncbi:Chromosome partitioning protein ParA [Andreprevotia sp. IGB-42]|uniref:ParA family protein n=1 Tax=Andreprevotia sp. IGB-42 TaxID=2497473 RepID=UPI00135892CA|nr:ParA family protein [Andreprevotia sp. IGB-42]KAF0813257.1 Chromosome partitioning protein ParA [Andreprevotia sp. IGB-42]